MRKALLLVAAAATVVSLAGCSKNSPERLQGKWLGDSVTNMAPEQLAEVSAWVKGVSFEFSGDKMIVTIPAEQPRAGSFEISAVEDDTMNVVIKRDTGEKDEAKLVMASDDELRWDIGDGHEVVMMRL